MTAWAAARAAARELAAAGIADPQFEAEYLTRCATGLDRAQFFAGASLPAGARAVLHAAIVRRLRREPAAYIAGEREFAGHRFLVTPDVLVPRPETELLAEAGIAELGALVPHAATEPIVADVGTGSGCIAVTVALAAPAARVIGIDASGRALAVAHENARRLGARVAFVRGDLLSAVASADVVLANLPYIPTEELDELQPEVRDWEPRSALDGGPDGLRFVRRLIADCGSRIRPRLLALEVARGQAAEVAALGQSAGAAASVALDLAGIERMVCLRWE